MTLAIAEELHRLHSCDGLVHKALFPSSILYSRATRRAQFLDLSRASLLLADRAASSDSSPLTLSLHDAARWIYSSPEQSGKANRAIDSRSDLYSLGCILHQMMTGRPPFVSSDPLELIHMHLARAPPNICATLPRPAAATAVSTSSNQPSALVAVMQAVQSITTKLMQKQAEERSVGTRRAQTLSVRREHTLFPRWMLILSFSHCFFCFFVFHCVADFKAPLV
jgi:serine/threonine protein kinase